MDDGWLEITVPKGSDEQIILAEWYAIGETVIVNIDDQGCYLFNIAWLHDNGTTITAHLRKGVPNVTLVEIG